MKAITRRIRRLETIRVPQEDPESQRIADRLRERRRELAEERGGPFEDPPPLPPGLSIAEILIRRRDELYRRYKEQEAAAIWAAEVGGIAANNVPYRLDFQCRPQSFHGKPRIYVSTTWLALWIMLTNVIESPQSGVRRRTHNVSRWRDSEMVERWVASEEYFRRIDGHEHLWNWAAILGRETTSGKKAKVA